jgi:hypothetical protein
MIEPSDEIARVSALRIEIEGSWSVEDFRGLLLTLSDIYERLGTLMVLGDLLRQEERPLEPSQDYEGRDKGQDRTWWNLYIGYIYSWAPNAVRVGREPLPKVLDAVRPFVFPLSIDAVRMESPGWIQVLGNLNPLKVVADFISRWRAENTKRIQIQTTADVDRERLRSQIAQDQERMRRAFALEVLHQLPESARQHAAERLAEIAEHSITPTINALEKLSTDARLGNAELLPSGAPLPASPRRRNRRVH